MAPRAERMHKRPAPQPPGVNERIALQPSCCSSAPPSIGPNWRGPAVDDARAGAFREPGSPFSRSLGEVVGVRAVFHPSLLALPSVLWQEPPKASSSSSVLGIRVAASTAEPARNARGDPQRPVWQTPRSPIRIFGPKLGNIPVSTNSAVKKTLCRAGEYSTHHPPQPTTEGHYTARGEVCPLYLSHEVVSTLQEGLGMVSGSRLLLQAGARSVISAELHHGNHVGQKQNSLPQTP